MSQRHPQIVLSDPKMACLSAGNVLSQFIHHTSQAQQDVGPGVSEQLTSRVHTDCSLPQRVVESSRSCYPGIFLLRLGLLLATWNLLLTKFPPFTGGHLDFVLSFI